MAIPVSLETSPVSGSMSHVLSERGNSLTCQQSRTCGYGERGSLWSDCMSVLSRRKSPFRTLDSSVNQERRREERVPLDRWDSFRKWKQILIIFISLTWLELEEMFRFLPAKSKSHCWRQLCFCFSPDPEIRPLTRQPLPLTIHLHLRSDWGSLVSSSYTEVLCLKGSSPLPAWAQCWRCFCQLSKWKRNAKHCE